MQRPPCNVVGGRRRRHPSDWGDIASARAGVGRRGLMASASALAAVARDGDLVPCPKREMDRAMRPAWSKRTPWSDRAPRGYSPWAGNAVGRRNPLRTKGEGGRSCAGEEVLPRATIEMDRPMRPVNPKTRVGPGGASQPHDRYFITRPRRMGKGRIASAARSVWANPRGCLTPTERRATA